MKRKLMAIGLIVFTVGQFKCTETEEVGFADSGLVESSPERRISVLDEAIVYDAKYFHTGVGSPITREEGLRWMAHYQRENPTKIRSHFFGSDAYKRILEQKGVVGISLTYGIDDDGDQQLILVGIDENGKMVLPSPSNNNLEVDGEIEDKSLRCPPFCATQD